MDKQAFKDEILLQLTGGLLELEIDDTIIDKIINATLREVQRYITSTKLVTIPFSQCIDLSEYKVNTVVAIYRTEPYGTNTSQGGVSGVMDPMYASQWQLISGTGNLYNFQDYVYNYASWNTLAQIRNTTSTDLDFRFDKSSNNLYVNIAMNRPSTITIEYIPRFDDISEVWSDYWIDVILRLATAQSKVIVGRIRSRYKLSNALWVQDGDTMLAEGLQEVADIREKLLASTQLVYPID